METDEINYFFNQNVVKLPNKLILPVSKATRQIQSIFPEVDISPLLSDIIHDFSDSTLAVPRLKKTIHEYFKGLMDTNSDDLTKRKNYMQTVINTLDHGILMEQSCIDILYTINELGIRINQFLSYKFLSILDDGSIVLIRYENFNDFCKHVYGR